MSQRHDRTEDDLLSLSQAIYFLQFDAVNRRPFSRHPDLVPLDSSSLVLQWLLPMAQHQDSDSRRMPSLHNLLKMLVSSNSPNSQGGQEKDSVEEPDEPPDSHIYSPGGGSLHHSDGPINVKSPKVACKQKESLLTRALMGCPGLSPTNSDTQRLSFYNTVASYPQSNASGHSTAGLTSDGDLTSPSLSNTSSPPIPSQLTHTDTLAVEPKTTPNDPRESVVEANLGRKRCISFACGRKVDGLDQSKTKANKAETQTDKIELPRWKPTITFACPVRELERRAPATTAGKASPRPRLRGSPAPSVLRTQDVASRIRTANGPQTYRPERRPGSIHMTGLGGFQPSEETRFHEFASSVEEDDEWVNQTTEYKGKITLSDCMRMENAIRKLGEEAEAEAIEEEQEAEGDGVGEDDSTVHDFSSDDGNESDNEAGFADSDESDDGSEDGFWAPGIIATPIGTENVDVIRQAIKRRNSITSNESFKHDENQKWLPAPARRKFGRSRGMKRPPCCPSTPDLPDSTDFVCGTLDEDRPLEAAYISCMEERRRNKHVTIPQDIDPSFPTTDPDDNDILDEEDECDVGSSVEVHKHLHKYDDDALRGRRKTQSLNPSPPMSPTRLHSPVPRPLGHSPKRLKSPPPPMKQRPLGLPATLILPAQPEGVDITGLVQRPYYGRTKSLPRTPNPFFISMEKWHFTSRAPSSAGSPERGVSRSREMHTRGPIDIIQGLERKRQKRKEKFWRQHCRKAAKEQLERRPIPGKGAERMKELGLEVAERLRAYGIAQDTQLVLSV